MENRPAPKPESKSQLTKDIESESLEFHVAISRERHDEISARFDRVDARMEKIELNMERGFSKIEKIIMIVSESYSSTSIAVVALETIQA